jgi:hypothetical protein
MRSATDNTISTNYPPNTDPGGLETPGPAAISCPQAPEVELRAVARVIARLFVVYAGFLLTLPKGALLAAPDLPVGLEVASHLRRAMQSDLLVANVRARMLGVMTNKNESFQRDLAIPLVASLYKSDHQPVSLPIEEFFTLGFVPGAQKAIRRAMDAAGFHLHLVRGHPST